MSEEEKRNCCVGGPLLAELRSDNVGFVVDDVEL
jgi:hypothetical protein